MYMGFFLRSLEGFGDAFALVAVFSLAAHEFPDHRDLVFGILEAAYGVGFTLGPLIGEILYAEVGFRDCFFYVSLILLPPILLIPFLKIEKEPINEVVKES